MHPEIITSLILWSFLEKLPLRQQTVDYFREGFGFPDKSVCIGTHNHLKRLKFKT